MKKEERIKRSEVDEGTKRNLISNMERRIEKLTIDEEYKKRLKDQLWKQLRRNEYGKRKERKKERKWNEDENRE